MAANLGDQKAFNAVYYALRRGMYRGRPVESSGSWREHPSGRIHLTLTYADDLQPHRQSFAFGPEVNAHPYRKPKKDE